MNSPLTAKMSAMLGKTANPALASVRARTDWFEEFTGEPGHALEQEFTMRTTNAGPIRDQGSLDTTSELRLLSASLMTMQEIERKRIASDLHDSIGQSLSALSCGIAAALEGSRKGRSEATASMLEKLAFQCKEAILEVQRIAMDLRPAMLDDIGLSATLTWFFREFQYLHPKLKLDIDVDIEECAVGPALRTNIFRIIQEALSNIDKHACASEARVRLCRFDREIHLEVIDNGIGFDSARKNKAARPSSGMGLKSMRERAEFSGGLFCVISLPDKGSRIFITWPLVD
jgi:signal transduction histidine kinase